MHWPGLFFVLAHKQGQEVEHLQANVSVQRNQILAEKGWHTARVWLSMEVSLCDLWPTMQQEGYGIFKYKLTVLGNMQWVIGLNQIGLGKALLFLLHSAKGSSFSHSQLHKEWENYTVIVMCCQIRITHYNQLTQG